MLLTLKLNKRIRVGQEKVNSDKRIEVFFIFDMIFLHIFYIPALQIASHITLSYAFSDVTTFGAAAAIPYLV